MGAIKSFIKQTKIYDLFKRLKHRGRVARGKRHRLQFAFASKKYPLVHLGTGYGGWTFVDHPDLQKSIIISAGLGEDASFDVAFASRYDAKVILVDPTPRAVHHFEQLTARLGLPSTKPFNRSGTQDVASYDLSTIKPSQLVLVPKALWNECSTIKFFEPRDKEHVSHSIHNYQNDYRDDTDHIEVATADVFSILRDLSISVDDVKLVKLDIEGAEIEVVKHMFSQSFFPSQILVEFDELNALSERACRRVDEIDDHLREHGYRLIRSDGQADFLYYRAVDQG